MFQLSYSYHKDGLPEHTHHTFSIWDDTVASNCPLPDPVRKRFHKWIKTAGLTGYYRLNSAGYAIVDVYKDQDAAILKLSFNPSLFED